MTRMSTIAYWCTTVALTAECLIGGLLGAAQYPPYAGFLTQLGYPLYFMVIIGVWYMLAGAAVAAPGFPRLKEWAYAGLVINYTGAIASHLAAGDGVGATVAPAVFTALTTVSWALRPSSRRLAGPTL